MSERRLTLADKDGGREIWVVPKVRGAARVGTRMIETVDVTDLETRAGRSPECPSATPTARDEESMGMWLLILFLLFRRSLETQVLGEDLHKDRLDPGRHFMGGRWAVIDVENANGHNDGESNEGHREEEIFTQEWDCEGCGRDDFRQEEDKHSQGKEDGDAERHFLTWIWREIENKDREEGNPYAGNDEVHIVIERLSTEDDTKNDVNVRLIATTWKYTDRERQISKIIIHTAQLTKAFTQFDKVKVFTIIFLGSLGRNLHNIPFDGDIVVL